MAEWCWHNFSSRYPGGSSGWCDGKWRKAWIDFWLGFFPLSLDTVSAFTRYSSEWQRLNFSPCDGIQTTTARFELYQNRDVSQIFLSGMENRLKKFPEWHILKLNRVSFTSYYFIWFRIAMPVSWPLRAFPSANVFCECFPAPAAMTAMSMKLTRKTFFGSKTRCFIYEPDDHKTWLLKLKTK